jgi:hypothetical protein
MADIDKILSTSLENKNTEAGTIAREIILTIFASTTLSIPRK